MNRAPSPFDDHQQPSLALFLRDPAREELVRLWRRLHNRECITPIERVMQEVGPAAFLAIDRLIGEHAAVIRHGRVVALLSGSYMLVLGEYLWGSAMPEYPGVPVACARCAGALVWWHRWRRVMVTLFVAGG